MKNKSKSAFTLIEVVLAMAVVAFALLAIVGLLPVGLNSMRDSQNEQAVSTITNQLRTQFQQVPFTNTGPMNVTDQTNYYTVEGLQLTQTNDPAMPPYYIATFAIQPAAVNGSQYQLSNAAQIITTLVSPYNSPHFTNTISMLETKQTGL